MLCFELGSKAQTLYHVIRLNAACSRINLYTESLGLCWRTVECCWKGIRDKFRLALKRQSSCWIIVRTDAIILLGLHYGSIRQHTLAYVGIRQHTSALKRRSSCWIIVRTESIILLSLHLLAAPFPFPFSLLFSLILPFPLELLLFLLEGCCASDLSCVFLAPDLSCVFTPHDLACCALISPSMLFSFSLKSDICALLGGRAVELELNSRRGAQVLELLLEVKSLLASVSFSKSSKKSSRLFLRYSGKKCKKN